MNVFLHTVIGECLGMTDFSSDPLLESESCAVLCRGAMEARESIKLYKTTFFFFFIPPLISEMNISISVLPLGRLADEGQYKFQR